MEKEQVKPAKANSLIFIMKEWIPYLRAKYGRRYVYQLAALYQAIYAVSCFGEHKQPAKIASGDTLFVSLRGFGSLLDMHPMTVSKYLFMLKDTNPPLLSDVSVIPKKGTKIIVAFPIPDPKYTEDIVLGKKRQPPKLTERKSQLLTQLALLTQKYNIDESLLGSIFKDIAGRKFKSPRLYSESVIEKVIADIESVQCKDVQTTVQYKNEHQTVHSIL